MLRSMLSKRALFAFAVAAGLSAGAHAASDPHGHAGAPPALTLNKGQKWQTDEALRQGMDEIRAAMAAALPRIHQRQFAPDDFAALAERVQGQVDHIVSNCQLPEDADAQLHVVLAQVLDGIAALKGRNGQDQGAVAIVAALHAYGAHFAHPGWAQFAH